MNETFRVHPEQASTFAHDVDALYIYLCGVSAFFTLLILALIVYFAFRYKRRRDDEVPHPHEGGVALEIVWSIIPLAFAMSFFVWGARVYFRMYRPPADALDIHVVGKQWMWKAQHPTGARENNMLHVPLGRPVRLIVSSQDVIHSFFIPAFRMKVDAVPGRYTVAWFEATRTGTYHLFCAEYCGTLHSGMIGRVVVMKPDEYQAWLSGSQPEETPVAAGARHFQSFGCNTCHGVVAPTMAGLFGSQVRLADGRTAVADEQYLRRSIVNSTADIAAGYQPIMPSFRGQMSEEQLTELIEYIKSVRDVSGAAATETGPAERLSKPANVGGEPR